MSGANSDDDYGSDSGSNFVRVNSRSGQALPNYNENSLHETFSDSDAEFDYLTPAGFGMCSFFILQNAC